MTVQGVFEPVPSTAECLGWALLFPSIPVALTLSCSAAPHPRDTSQTEVLSGTLVAKHLLVFPGPRLPTALLLPFQFIKGASLQVMHWSWSEDDAINKNLTEQPPRLPLASVSPSVSQH